MFATLYANSHAITITGKEAAIAKAGGSNNPEALAKVIGISPPKYSIAVNGQNANANAAPIKKALR